MKTKYLIGSISHGTMRPQDLIPCFVGVLDELNDARYGTAPATEDYSGQTETYKAIYSRIKRCLAEIEQSRASFPSEDDYYNSEDCQSDLEYLFDELNNFAPSYFYFGAHPGDGSDYGFWLSESWEEEFDGLKVSDTSTIPAPLKRFTAG